MAILLVIIAAIIGGIWYFFYTRRQSLRNRLNREFEEIPQGASTLGLARQFWDALRQAENPQGYVDDITWNDLDMDEVYNRVDGCHCALGDIGTYTALRMPRSQTPEALQNREILLEKFKQNPALRLDVQEALYKIGRWNGIGLEVVLYTPQRLGLKHSWVYVLCALLPLGTLPMLLWGPPPAIMWLILSLMANYALHSWTREKHGNEFRSLRYIASAVKGGKKITRLLANQLPAHAAALQQAVGRFAPFRFSFALLALDHYYESAGLPNLPAFLQLPLLAYQHLSTRMAGKKQDILHLYTLLGDVDMAVSVLSLRQNLPVDCKPVFTQENILQAQHLCHPLLEDPVPNSGSFSQGVLLTGSNASGKSTFIKAVAINCILAQSLNTCAASQFTLRRAPVATSMAVADSIIDGDSYFIAEIKSMRRLIQLTQAEGFCYLFVDEILKGTNTVERIAAAAGVLRHLQSTQSLCFAATHDIELTNILQACFTNYHFRETVNEKGVQFDYKLHSGPAVSRNALLLLEHMGFPDDILHFAGGLAAEFEANGSWPANGFATPAAPQ